MKHLIKYFITVFITAVMLPSCKSNDDKLESLTSQISKITHQLSRNPSADNVRKAVANYESLTKRVPSSLIKLNKEEFMDLYGSDEFIEAVSAYYSTLSMAVIETQSNGLEDIAGMFNNILNMASDFEGGNSNSTSTSSNKWDKVLDRYEKMADETIVIYKKMAAGDKSVMKNYTTIYSNLMKMNKELEDAEDDMTPEQSERYGKISLKMSMALMGEDTVLGEISNIFNGLFEEDEEEDEDEADFDFGF